MTHKKKMDTKERNFCFAYNGRPLSVPLLKSLHIVHAEGVQSDGNWFARLSLHRSYGRRMATIPKIIDEYNRQVSEEGQILLSVIPPFTSSVICFKASESIAANPILRRIHADSKTNPTYWCLETPRSKGKRQPKEHSDEMVPVKPIATGLESLVRELNLDPTKLDMQGAYMTVSRNYFASRNTEMGNSGQFDAKDRMFLINQLTRIFNKEMAFTTKPFASSGNRPPKTASGIITALVKSNGGSAQDFEFIRDDLPLDFLKPNPYTTGLPNNSICEYFRKMLPLWGDVESVYLSAMEIATGLNGHTNGAHPSTCVLGFVRAFIEDKIITAPDQRNGLFKINIQSMREKLFMHS